VAELWFVTRSWAHLECRGKGIHRARCGLERIYRLVKDALILFFVNHQREGPHSPAIWVPR
jgi:hypothetical protein